MPQLSMQQGACPPVAEVSWEQLQNIAPPPLRQNGAGPTAGFFLHPPPPRPPSPYLPSACSLETWTRREEREGGQLGILGWNALSTLQARPPPCQTSSLTPRNLVLPCPTLWRDLQTRGGRLSRVGPRGRGLVPRLLGLDLWVRAGKASIQHPNSWRPGPSPVPSLPPLPPSPAPAVFFCPVTGSREPDPWRD